jgi:DNA polymerase-3 subunit alpha
MIASKGYCGYFLQVADYVNAMKAEGCRVGPGRGSGGGSLVAYLARIVGIDPIEAGLMFERFMTEGRTALPDFDIDFPSTWRHRVQDYITHRYGEEHVARVGTHLRLKNKGIVKDLGRAMKAQLPETAWKDLDEVAKIITEAEITTAGLGLSWDELWAQEGEVLQPYADKYPGLFEMAGKLVGILKSYGKHPAGLIASDESLIDSLPLRDSEDGQMITQWGMTALEALGYVKWDLLTLRTLDTIQTTVDLVKANRGHEIDMDDWKEEYQDPQVWEALSDGHTLGVFQVETPSGTRLMKQMRPANLNEFADVQSLVRPGPKRSGLTKLYLERRAGLAPITYPDPRLEQVLARTYGCMIYQEDVMQTTMLLAGYDSTKADEVRSILGKKKVEKVIEAGREFVQGCVENGMTREAADVLWAQMAEFARYSFNRAHAFGYAVLAFWTAWLKVHYPVEFYTSVMSTVPNDRVPEFINEARQMGLAILPPDVNESGRSFTCQGLSVRYGLEAIGGIGVAAATSIINGQPYASYEDFRDRSGVHSGVVATLAKIGAFDTMMPNRRGLETLLLMEKTGASSQCTWKVPECGTGPQGVCTFPWESEPAPVNPRTGKTLKAKPPPKRCTKACRQYTAPEPVNLLTIEPYTDEDIRNIEMEVLKVHLSSTVFDMMPDDWRQAALAEADRLEEGGEDNFVLAVAITKVRKHTDRNGNQMAFLGVATERGELDVTVFSKAWQSYKHLIVLGSLRLFEVQQNAKGLTLQHANTPRGRD